MFNRIKTWINGSPNLRRAAIKMRRFVAPTRDDRLHHMATILGRELDNPTFIKVGANDGVSTDPFGDAFLAGKKWRGVLVEPVPYLVQKLASVYSDPSRFAIEAVAIGAASGTTNFYFVAENARHALPQLPPWYDQVGSFDRQHVISQLGTEIEPFVIAGEVPVKPLIELVRQRQLRDITILQIDTEGYDFEVLKSAELGQCIPHCVLIEHWHLKGDEPAAMQSMFRDAGYRVVDTGGDYLAVHQSAPPLVQTASRPLFK